MTYNLRWQWLLGNFDGLREGIDPLLVERVAGWLPASLRRAPAGWAATDVLRHFQAAYALLVLSRVLANLGVSCAASVREAA